MSSDNSKIFSKAPIEMPNKSGFDMSHENFFTAYCGTLTPCLVDYLLPNDTVSVGFNCQVQLPPMATDFYGEVVGKYELFFVPYRILYGGWKDYIAPMSNSDSYSIPAVSGYQSFPTGSLGDYLGAKLRTSNGSIQRYNIFPFLAYHKVWDDWYRDARVQIPCFTNYEGASHDAIYALPWNSFYSLDCIYGTSNEVTGNSYLDDTLYNGVSLFDFHQRNWPKDYFTNCTAQPEAGDPASLSFNVSGSQGSFTIAGLRAANSLQMFMERNNMAGQRYQDRIKVHYGVYPSDAVTDKALYLGSGFVNVYCKSVFQTAYANNNGDSSFVGQVNNNPFDMVASKYGSSQGVGGGSLCKKFTATEHGILMCLFSLVPRRYYLSGCRRQLCYYNNDFVVPYPSLAGVGDQEIYKYELSNNGVNSTFGYSQRYSEYKFMNNEVHGLLRSGSSLESFCLQTFYDSAPSLGSEFLEIPTSYMDGVCCTTANVSKFGCWNDTYFTYKKISTLPAYSIPTLENMKHSHVETVNLGGTRL